VSEELWHKKTTEVNRGGQKVLFALQSCRRSRHFGRLCSCGSRCSRRPRARWVWVFSRILKEFQCSIVQELLDGWKICFPMKLHIPDEPEDALKTARRNLFVHVSPDRRAIHHSRFNNLSVDCYFVLYGHLASLKYQRIK
jgi:hypothetical protein